MTVTRTSARSQGVKKTSRPAPNRQVRKVATCRAPRPGQPCPQCKKGRLDYNGLLQLSCPSCGYVAEGGGFT
ncbi:MAG TPA: hypothetical protein VLM78_02665 [Anaerolineales bacterium]|nr:hypothetical protein [Anaerolineales bacterium]